MNYYEKIHQIRGLVLDIDGVLTDNTILVSDQGEFLRTMNVRDGYAMKKAMRAGLKIGIISGGRSIGTLKRFEILGIADVHLGIENKLPVFISLIEKWQLTADDVAYMGDDIPDLECLTYAGLAACPNDAVPEVLDCCAYISRHAGGMSCVRDLIENILRSQSLW